MQLVAGLMRGQQVQAIREDLSALQHPVRTDDDALVFSTVPDRARAYRYLRLALPILQTLPR